MSTTINQSTDQSNNTSYNPRSNRSYNYRNKLQYKSQNNVTYKPRIKQQLNINTIRIFYENNKYTALVNYPDKPLANFDVKFVYHSDDTMEQEIDKTDDEAVRMIYNVCVIRRYIPTITAKTHDNNGNSHIYMMLKLSIGNYIYPVMFCGTNRGYGYKGYPSTRLPLLDENNADKYECNTNNTPSYVILADIFKFSAWVKIKDDYYIMDFKSIGPMKFYSDNVIYTFPIVIDVDETPDDRFVRAASFYRRK